MSDRVSIVALSKEVADDLTRRFCRYYTARHNGLIVYPDLKDLAQLRVDVFPASLELTSNSRAGNSKLVAIHIAFQQRAPTQETMDYLSDLATESLESLIDKRYQGGTVYSSGGSFIGSNVFDKLAEYEENVFQSILEVNFQRII